MLAPQNHNFHYRAKGLGYRAQRESHDLIIFYVTQLLLDKHKFTNSQKKKKKEKKKKSTPITLFPSTGKHGRMWKISMNQYYNIFFPLSWVIVRFYVPKLLEGLGQGCGLS